MWWVCWAQWNHSGVFPLWVRVLLDRTNITTIGINIGLTKTKHAHFRQVWVINMAGRKQSRGAPCLAVIRVAFGLGRKPVLCTKKWRKREVVCPEFSAHLQFPALFIRVIFIITRLTSLLSLLLVSVRLGEFISILAARLRAITISGWFETRLKRFYTGPLVWNG